MKYLYIIMFVLSFGCSQSQLEVKLKNKASKTNLEVEILPKEVFIDTILNRNDLKIDLLKKKEEGKDIVIHVFVPLCDNENQGIVPTSKSLGDGLSLRTNLYWATSHGMKRYFESKNDWNLLYSQKDLDTNVLERVIFSRRLENGAKVYLIEDAYRGDRMIECLEDYFNALSENTKDSCSIKSNLKIGVNGNADMLVFNGHNGLMDTRVNMPENKSLKMKDAVVIACISKNYFNEHIINYGAYPLVMTENLLYPGAFILDGIIESWLLNKTNEEIKCSAGDAYHGVKKCGQKGARALFSTGW